MFRISRTWGGAVLLALIILSSGDNAAATPTISYDNPRRPTDSRLILATTGIVLRYELIVSITLIASRLTIRNDITGSDTTFSLSFDTSVDGHRLSCSDGNVPPTESSPALSNFDSYLSGIVAQNHLCSRLPSDVIVGKTRIVVLYWQHLEHDPPSPFYDFNQNPGSDAIWVVH